MSARFTRAAVPIRAVKNAREGWDRAFKMVGEKSDDEPFIDEKNIIEMGSLLEGIPRELSEELFDTICSTDNVKIERIVSRGHASPEGFWYDQEKNEFILVVKGSAGLKLEHEDHIVVLKAGDYFNIGAHVKHRVEWTDFTCETIWLAVYY